MILFCNALVNPNRKCENTQRLFCNKSHQSHLLKTVRLFCHTEIPACLIFSIIITIYANYCTHWFLSFCGVYTRYSLCFCCFLALNISTKPHHIYTQTPNPYDHSIEWKLRCVFACTAIYKLDSVLNQNDETMKFGVQQISNFHVLIFQLCAHPCRA